MNTKIRTALENHPELEFHLCGSQYLGTQTEASDYDYCIQYSHEAMIYLLELGFSTLIDDHLSYIGVNSVRVMEILDPELRKKIQVDLSSNVEAKLHVMRVLEKYPALKELDRQAKLTDAKTRPQIWNAFLELTLFESRQ